MPFSISPQAEKPVKWSVLMAGMNFQTHADTVIYKHGNVWWFFAYRMEKTGNDRWNSGRGISWIPIFDAGVSAIYCSLDSGMLALSPFFKN